MKRLRKGSYFFYGKSMRGTFRVGDRLLVSRVPFEQIKPGDVIVYWIDDGSGEKKEIAHRVVAVRPGGLITKGDSNPQCDPDPVTPANFLGRVECVERGGKVLIVQNGWLGVVRSMILGLLWRAEGSLKFIGRLPYRWLRRRGIIALLWRPQITEIRLNTERGPIIKYLCHGKTVARQWLKENRLECQKPYDLILWRILSHNRRA